MFGFFLVFFFSSRRRHTRWPRDWSSDVCSSDLLETNNAGEVLLYGPLRDIYFNTSKGNSILRELKSCEEKRSEERRVGKECRSRGAQEAGQKKSQGTSRAKTSQNARGTSAHSTA